MRFIGMVEKKPVREVRTSLIDKRGPASYMDSSARKKSAVLIKAKETIRLKDDIKTAELIVDKLKISTENGRNGSQNKLQSLEPLSVSPNLRPGDAVLQRTFGKVVISLENCLTPEERLLSTPSMAEGVEPRTEWYLRRLGCDIIQHAGILLKLPQTAMATAQVLYQRFYYIKSFIRFDYLVMGMACIYLSSKIEEAPRRLRDIINVCNHIRQVFSNEPIEPILVDHGYVDMKNRVIKSERRLLKELGFCVHVKHPHKFIVTYLQMLGLDQHQQFVQKAWNYMNDSLRTDLFVRYPPESIACGCIFLAARALQIPLPRKPTMWYELFMVKTDVMMDIATNILLLYSIKLPSIQDIEAPITRVRSALDDARSKGPLAEVRDAEGGKTPESVQTTPEGGKDVDRRDSRDEDKLREKRRHRDHSPDRKESKRHRSRSPHRDNRRHHSRSRSPKRKPSYDDRKVSPRRSSPVRSKIHPPKTDRDDRDRPGSRSRSRDLPPRKRSRSRSTERRSRSHKDRDYERRY